MIIGLGHKARVGKDETGKYLQRYYHFTQAAFADKLKHAAMEIFDLTYDQVYGDNKEDIDPRWNDTPRHMLQTTGTAMRNHYGKDVWIRALERRLQREGMDNDWCITDVRLPNEAEAVKRWGGYLVKVERPNAPKIATDKHESETLLDDFTGWDYILNNSSDLVQLYANIEVMLGRFAQLHATALAVPCKIS